MRLDYNVLWVDDQPNLVLAQAKALQRAMEGEGFELKPTQCLGMDEVDQHLADGIFTDEVDLVLVDWDLGNAKPGGDKVISKIRETIPFTDVVFYSANIDIVALRKASFDEEHDGVYIVHRNSLVDEVTQLFKATIKRVLDLDHTRGIVMGATSDVDQLARECLQLAHDLLDDAGKDGVLAEMVALLDEKVTDTTKTVGKLKTGDVARILEAHRTFSANDGLRILTRLLESDQFKTHQAHTDDVKRYIKEVVPKRNILGHKVLKPDGKPAGIAGDTQAETITLAEMRELRCLLLELRHKFRDLHGALAGGA